jgi:hypothetical protein
MSATVGSGFRCRRGVQDVLQQVELAGGLPWRRRLEKAKPPDLEAAAHGSRPSRV